MVGNNTYTLTIESCETDDDIACKVAVYFHELTVINYGTDYLIHVVSHVRIVGDNLVQAIFLAVDGVGAFNAGSTLHVVLRNVREEATDNACKLFFCLSRKVANTTLR